MPSDAPTSSDNLTLSVLLAHSEESVALIGPDATMSYGDVADAVAARVESLQLATRSVVLLTGPNSVDWVVTYLALVAAGHVPLLGGANLGRIVDRWGPAAVVTTDESGFSIERRRCDAPELHPDLALLMSTSGSTGNPKLVRLSAQNLRANATSIAAFQRLTPVDRGITNLPLNYSFGLSVLNSHLIAGGSVVITSNSVVDHCFARALRDHEVTNVAGVPYTYDLVDQVGPDRLHVPSIRFFAQAGGRMEPERVAQWAARARSWGVEWFSMYGQTEATARMSYVPPDLVHRHPGTIGIAIPGGEFTVESFDDDPASPVPVGDVGEVVYRGPNVMMGYADAPPDLAEGRHLSELRTGDLGRVDPESGLLSIVGRRARRVKPFGLRLDLDDVERELAASGCAARVAGDDEGLVIAVPQAAPDVLDRASEVTGLPTTRLRVVVGEAPRTVSGKVDYAAMLALARPEPPAEESSDLAARGRLDAERALVAAYQLVLGRSYVTTADSFVSLGGDSLSYVECSVRAERIVGHLPSDWHLRPISELAVPTRRRPFAWVDTTVVLRVVAILAVVSTHMGLRHVPGGSHLLLGVVGYNVARFLLAVEPTSERLRAGGRTILRVAVPTVAWTLAFMVVGEYTWTTVTLVNNYIGPESHLGNHWHFWFVEVMIHLIAATILLTAIPIVRRADVRWPYLFPVAVFVGVLQLRFVNLGDLYNLRFRTHSIAWFFVLGWIVQRSTTLWKRVATTIICFTFVLEYFNSAQRELFIATGLVLLAWAPAVPLPRLIVRPVAVIAEATLWIYLAHFMIWPPLKQALPIEIAYVLTISSSVAVWWLATRLPRVVGIRLPRLLSDRSTRRRTGPVVANTV